MTAYQPGQLYQVPLAEVQSDPNQPRKYMDPAALEELTASVGQMGVIQPIVCRQDGATGLVYTVAGERRCAAARKAGLPAIPAVFVNGDNCAEMALVENLLRADLTPIEEAEALKRLMDAHAYQQDQLAQIIGKSVPTISETLSLNRLPKEIRDECRQNPLVPKRVLVEIARKKQERGMVTQFNQYKEKQQKAAAKEAAAAAVPAARKRTKTEALTANIALAASKIDEIDFPAFSADDRAALIDAMNAMKEILEAAITRAVKNWGKAV
ncbi:MAG: ParB/RepB/Spo0J family partition protein [Deltaproteobacteria bacterium]|nr:ParB/RepB/Spo0J family partition protein [Deltaproteobacteria bacterium]